MSEKRITKETLDQVLQAKSVDELRTMLEEYRFDRTPIKLEDSAFVTGGIGRVHLNDDQTKQVVGGGHYITCSGGDKMWVDLVDNGYVMGTDPIFDKALLLEQIAISGFPIEVVIDVACELIPLRRLDVDMCIRTSGPVYLATCYKNGTGYGLSGDNL